MMSAGLLAFVGIVIVATEGASVPAAPTVVADVPVPVRERPGFTASFGFGSAYGFPGVQLRYDRPLRSWLHLAPFVAGGILSSDDLTWMTGAAGVSAGLGWRHRLAVDVAVVPVGWEVFDLHGVVVASRTSYGPSVAGGYEHFSNGGWMLRATVGYGWGIWGKGEGLAFSGMTLTLGVGMRLW